jgi:hypothetical protein
VKHGLAEVSAMSGTDRLSSMAYPMKVDPLFLHQFEGRSMKIYRENRIQESGVRIQEKSGSCLFSWTGVASAAP